MWAICLRNLGYTTKARSGVSLLVSAWVYFKKHMMGHVDGLGII